MKRFYKQAGVAPAPAGFQVTLDGKPVRTPAQAPLVVPQRGLAEAIAAEWQAQGEKVEPASMGLMKLACTVIDRIGPQRTLVEDELARFAGTDLLCYRADEPEKLARRQQAAWQPLLDWAADTFDAPLTVTAGVMPVAQDDQALQALARALRTLDDWRLMVLHSATTLTGSLVLGLAVVQRRITVAEAWTASRIDADFQIEQWGVDAEAEQAAANARRDILVAGRLLDLLRD